MAVPNRRLRDEREKCDLSQSELAERLGTTASNISRWERGITIPTPYFRRKLCELFQLSRDDLFRSQSDDLPTSKPEPPPFEEPSPAFFFNMALSDAHECFGRIREKGIVESRTRKGVATSLVGPRRIGKTWLLQYLLLTAPEQLGSNYHIGYLDSTAPQCASLQGTVTQALQALQLSSSPAVDSDAPLQTLEGAVKDLRTRNKIPVLCMDEFESFCKQHETCPQVFEHLRAITNAGLGMVVSSKRPLIDIVGEPGQTSPFFNIFRQVILKPFTRQEAQDFAQTKGRQVGFTNEECDHLLHYAQEQEREAWFPLRLQLVGTLLHEDKILAAQGAVDCYCPHDAAYWQEFKERLEEAYQGAVR